jgi:peptidoglycan/LPS O-acetylase OafA/YrhL
MSAQSPTAAAAAARSQVLDAIRAIAVLMVLGRHFINVVRGIPPELSSILQRWQAFGWMGVDLFFVLSGFLVSGLLFSEYQRRGSLRPWHFLGRRGFKIYPGFYLLLVVSWFWAGGSVPPIKFVYEAVFLQNYFGMVWNHTWSLAVEEHFYLALALLLWGLARFRGGEDPFRVLPKVCLAVFALVFALRLRQFSIIPRGYLLLPTHYRLDALLFGTLLAYYWAFHRARLAEWVSRRRALLVISSLTLLLPCLTLRLENSFVVNTVGLTMNYLGFGGLVIVAMVTFQDRATPRVLIPLARIGFYSYSIYLWHSPVAVLTARHLPVHIGWPATLAVYLVGSVLVGIAAALLVELPFLRLRDRLLPSRTPPATAPSMAAAA